MLGKILIGRARSKRGGTVRETAEKPRRKGRSGKSIEEVVSYSMGHRIRIEILTLLNEGVYTPDEISERLGEPLGKVTHHISELVDRGAIELARTEPARNWTRHYYRAVEQPYVSEEEALAMTPQQRQIFAGVVLQSIMAESMSAFWAGNMIDDPSNTLLSWRWFNVDREGQQEIIEELMSSWERVQEIEARATARLAESGEPALSIIVAMQGFRRSRPAKRPPAPQGSPE
jgi:DNA-binding transcriptional ArsR family regulator